MDPLDVMYGFCLEEWYITPLKLKFGLPCLKTRYQKTLWSHFLDGMLLYIRLNVTGKFGFILARLGGAPRRRVQRFEWTTRPTLTEQTSLEALGRARTRMRVLGTIDLVLWRMYALERLFVYPLLGKRGKEQRSVDWAGNTKGGRGAGALCSADSDMRKD